jgi:hypothetical protein
MSDFNSGDYKGRPFVSRGGNIYSNTPIPMQRPSFATPGGFRNTPESMLPSFTNVAGGQRSSGMAPGPINMQNIIPGYTGMTADAAARRAGEVAPVPEATPSNPMLDLLYQMFNQAGQGSGGRAADLSGYNASLKMLGRERKRMKKRYKKYEGQIADIYGTLTGINQSMIENIAPAGEAVRADVAAQEGQQAAATRSADAARLEAATQARAELGLEDLAGQYAGGDVATEQAEGMITDRAADTTAAQNTLLANEAIARQQLTNQNLGRTIQEESSTRDLQRSLEDALAAIRGERANVLMQRAQARSAAGGGSGPNLGAQLEILERIQQYTNPQPSGEPSALQTFQADNPTLANSAQQAADTFSEWIANNYNSIPAVQGSTSGKAPAGAIVNTFIDQISTEIPQARSWTGNSAMYNLLLQLATPAAK